MLTGNAIKSGKKIIDINEAASITSNKFTLKRTPKGALVSVFQIEPDGTNGKEFTLGTPATNEKEYSLAGKELTFHSDVVNGTNFRVYYKVETDETAKTVKVTSDAFGGTFKIVLDVLVRDEFSKKDYQGQLLIPNGKFEDNFNLDLAADGDPATVTLPVEILKSPVNTDMWELVIYDEELIV